MQPSTPTPSMIGHLLAQQGHATAAQVEEALLIQQGVPSVRLGEVLVHLGHVSLEDLAACLHTQGRGLRMGERLLLDGHLDRYALDLALEAEWQTGQPLGDVLVEMGLCPTELVKTVLQQKSDFKAERQSAEAQVDGLAPSARPAEPKQAPRTFPGRSHFKRR